MLTNLYIKNYALFSECSIDFHSGMNILTGETGAGKSLLVGALGLLLGKRSDTNVIFNTDQKCIVEAHFEKLSQNICKELNAFEDFDMEGNGVVVRRELSNAGKTRVFINDTPISVQILKQVMAVLIDLHGQNENQLLLEPEKQLRLLDEFAGTTILVEGFKGQLSKCNKIQSQIKQLESEEATAKQQFDYYSFMLQELAEANLQAEEEDNLEQEIKLLQNSEEIREALRFSVEEIYNSEQSAYQKISQALQLLSKVASFENTISQEAERLAEVKETLKEMTYSLQNLLESVEADPERLAFIEERLGVYYRLKRKYNVKTAAELIQICQEYETKIDHFSSIEDTIKELRSDWQKELQVLGKMGLEIEFIRKQHAEALADKVNILLQEVGFREARFRISLSRNIAENGILSIDSQNIRPASSGINKGEFLIRTNPGLPEGLLSEIASGGEISRVMLAIKAALADKAEFPVLIFDEIDTGISGEVANKVGNVMQKLSESFQILAITHLPQIAAKGTHQYLIFKEVSGGMTYSGVRRLAKQERVMEIAKMMGGDNPSASALKNAKELMG